MRIIKNRQIIEDAWNVLPVEGEPSANGDLFVGLGVWNEAAAIAKRTGKTAPVLRPGDDLTNVRDLAQTPLLAIEFPKYTDGRGYSVARLLRERYGFKGELRAVGNVLRDQLLYMQRCGFDAFALQPGKDIQGALEAFEELPIRYQADAELNQPLYRRVGR